MKIRQILRQLMAVAGIVIGVITATMSHGATVTQTRSTAATVAAGGTWTNAANAASINGSCALGDGSTSTSLTITGWSFAIPAEATILGITVRSVSSFNDASTQDQIRLTKTGSPVGTAKPLNGPGAQAIPSCGSPIPDSNGLTVGGSSDLWDTTWTVAQINASGFGVFYDNNFSNTAVDGVEITVTFDDGVEPDPDKIGVFRNGSWYLDYNGNGIWEGTVTDRRISFGLPGDIPVVGDWNPGTGFPAKIGTFRPSNSRWYLDWNGNDVWNGSVIDRVYSYGASTDDPVVGVWGGPSLSSSAKIARFTDFGGQGWWYLDYNGNGVPEFSVDGDWSFQFGLGTDFPVAGDWSGTNSYACPGVFREVSGQGRWYLDWNCNKVWEGGITDRVYTFGSPGDIPVVGDWNGDGRTAIGVFRIVNGQGRFYLDFNGNGIWEGSLIDRVYTFGSPGDWPVAGKW